MFQNDTYYNIAQDGDIAKVSTTFIFAPWFKHYNILPKNYVIKMNYDYKLYYKLKYNLLLFNYTSDTIT